MKILDLFSGAGGSAMGLHRAYPEATIVGVDINPMPRYPFTFVQADAMTYPLAGFDLVWASPPCQGYSWGTRKGREQKFDRLLVPTRERLVASGKPYIIENVEHAPLINPIKLCGEMFGLGVIRHRKFEANFPLVAPSHIRHRCKVSDGCYVTVAGHGGDGSNRYDLWSAAMGIDWMTKKELAEAIPPAYSEYLMKQYLEYAGRAREQAA